MRGCTRAVHGNLAQGGCAGRCKEVAQKVYWRYTRQPGAARAQKCNGGEPMGIVEIISWLYNMKDCRWCSVVQYYHHDCSFWTVMAKGHRDCGTRINFGITVFENIFIDIGCGTSLIKIVMTEEHRDCGMRIIFGITDFQTVFYQHWTWSIVD